MASISDRNYGPPADYSKIIKLPEEEKLKKTKKEKHEKGGEHPELGRMKEEKKLKEHLRPPKSEMEAVAARGGGVLRHPKIHESIGIEASAELSRKGASAKEPKQKIIPLEEEIPQKEIQELLELSQEVDEANLAIDPEFSSQVAEIIKKAPAAKPGTTTGAPSVRRKLEKIAIDYTGTGIRMAQGNIGSSLSQLPPQVQTGLLQSLGEAGSAVTMLSICHEIEQINREEETLKLRKDALLNLKISNRQEDQEKIQAEEKKIDQMVEKLDTRRMLISLKAGLNGITASNLTSSTVLSSLGQTAASAASMAPAVGVASTIINGASVINSIQNTLLNIKNIDASIEKIEGDIKILKEKGFTSDSPLIEALNLKLYYLKNGAKQEQIGLLMKDIISVISTTQGGASSLAAILGIKMMAVATLGPVGAGLVLSGVGISSILFYKANKIELNTMISKLPQKIYMYFVNRKINQIMNGMVGELDQSRKDIEKFKRQQETLTPKIEKLQAQVKSKKLKLEELKKEGGYAVGGLFSTPEIERLQDSLFKREQKLKILKPQLENAIKQILKSMEMVTLAEQRIDALYAIPKIKEQVDELITKQDIHFAAMQAKDRLGSRRKEADRWGVNLKTRIPQKQIDALIKEEGKLKEILTDEAPYLLKVQEQLGDEEAAQIFYGEDPFSQAKDALYKMVYEDSKITQTMAEGLVERGNPAKEQFEIYFDFYQKGNPQLQKKFHQDPGGTIVDFILANPAAA